jgi:hypothetical protein
LFFARLSSVGDKVAGTEPAKVPATFGEKWIFPRQRLPHAHVVRQAGRALELVIARIVHIIERFQELDDVVSDLVVEIRIEPPFVTRVPVADESGVVGERHHAWRCQEAWTVDDVPEFRRIVFLGTQLERGWTLIGGVQEIVDARH